MGFEPTISAGDRPKTYALDRAATICHTKPHFCCSPFKQFPRWIRTGLKREVRLYYDNVIPRIEIVEVMGSIVALLAGKTVEIDSPRGSLGRQWVAIQTFYLKHETCNLLGRGLGRGGGGGNTAKCRNFRR
jgi:hypothetical protein